MIWYVFKSEAIITSDFGIFLDERCMFLLYSGNTNNVRLWRSVPKKKFDLASFNEGNYQKSVEESISAENITSVLYPNDSTWEGKQLRLKQQYFFCCATIQDIVKRFKLCNTNWDDFPKLNQIQLNDTHPIIAAIELLRILLDVERLPYQ